MKVLIGILIGVVLTFAFPVGCFFQCYSGCAP